MCVGVYVMTLLLLRAAMATKIATMRTLSSHPNMLKLHDVFEDEEGFHVVLEYCKGAALLEQISNRVRGGGGAGQGRQW
jgi:serine/threonine protein kinase